MFIAADGGANSARVLGMQPGMIIGDLDSVKKSTLRAFASSVVVRVRRQDNTDLEKSLDFCLDAGITRVDLLGAVGGRLDMTFGNLTSLWQYSSVMELAVHGDGWAAFPVNGRAEFTSRKGATISVLPFGTCRGITLTGLKYGLRNATLGRGEVAVSNVALGSTFSVRCAKGDLLVIIQDELAERKR
jgi:thiamine pyrophosphokinase